MPLIFNDKIKGPKTHVFIIGVGNYPYLVGGKHQQQQEFDGANLLRSLSTSAPSAAAFYNTVIDLNQQKSWITPLGSVEVLISPLEDQEILPGVDYKPATMDNIERAYFEWKKRCDTDSDNVAIFYFCGHGLQKGEHYLLAEDFGHIPGNPWRHSIAFDGTRQGFFKCKADTQLFFVDACRQLTADMLQTEIPKNFIEAPDLTKCNCKYDLTQKAAAPGEKAFGLKGSVSFYTKALIAALTGKASINTDGHWTVNTSSISTHIISLLKNESPKEGYKQRCVSNIIDSVAIIRLPEAPLVTFTVNCDPYIAEPLADLSYEDLNSKVSRNERPPGPWKVQVPAGIYKIEAIFQCGSFANTRKFVPVHPPFANETITCHGKK